MMEKRLAPSKRPGKGRKKAEGDLSVWSIESMLKTDPQRAAVNSAARLCGGKGGSA